MALHAQIFQALLVAQRAGGVNLALGKAYFYVPGGTTAKAIYADRDKATPAANPYTLDTNGTAAIYGDGLYDIKITNAQGVQKFYWYNVAINDVSGVFYNVQDYASLSAAITTLGATPATLLIPSNQTVSANLTIPANIEIFPINGAIITINSAQTLTINGPFSPGNYQVFAGSGSVAGLKESKPIWWGTLNGTNVQKAVDAITSYGGVVLLGRNTYDFTDVHAVYGVHPKSNIRIIGEGRGNTVITATGRCVVAISLGETVDTTAVDDVEISGITFLGHNADPGPYPRRGTTNTNETTGKTDLLWGIIFKGDQESLTPPNASYPTVSNIKIHDCEFKNLELGGVVMRGVSGFLDVSHNTFYNCLDSILSFNQRILFSSNQILYSRDNGVSFERGNTNVACTGNTIEYSAYYSIWMGGYTSTAPNYRGPDGFTITGNVIKHSGKEAIYLQDAPKNGVVSGNMIDTVYRGPMDAQNDNEGIGIFATGYPATAVVEFTYYAENLHIVGNTIKNAYRTGIIGKGLHNCMIEDNFIIDAGTQYLNDGVTDPPVGTHNFGIYLNSTSASVNVMQAVIVKNNIILDTRPNPFTKRPIEFHYGNNCVIKNNRAINTQQFMFTNFFQDTNITNDFQSDGRELYAAAVPSTGTWNLNDRIIRRPPAVGQPKAWSCSTAGTFGVLAGVTGDITNGTALLTVNTTTGLAVNNYITIAGVTGVKRILAINTLVVTIDSNADATVTGAAVAYSTPTLTSEGNL